MTKFLHVLLFIIVQQSTVLAQVQLRETTLDTTTIITGLDIPWEIQWGPDDHIWTTERFGRVSRINPETGEQDIILDISDIVYQSGESGLLGMVLHPEFEANPYVYMAYTYRPAGQILEKIVRYKYDNGMLVDEFVLLDNITGNTTHDGCRMIILPDNTLLFTTGDAQNQPAAQDINSLNGKFLRLNLDGSIPDDNPFPDNPVYSFGHRNAQGLYLGPNGIIYSSEHGPNTDDEFNIIEAGRNYGWPNVHGFCDLPTERDFCDENDVAEPLAAWTPTVATSDIVYYDHMAIPEWKDHIIMTTLKNKRIYVLELDKSGTSVVGEEQLFTNWWGRLRDVLQGPNGEIYLATSGASWSNNNPFTHSIIKIWNPEAVSINEQENMNQSFKLYPNPASNNLWVTVEQELIGYQLNIYGTDGKSIFNRIIDSTEITIPIQKMKSGIYLAVISQGDKVLYSEKLIVNKD